MKNEVLLSLYVLQEFFEKKTALTYIMQKHQLTPRAKNLCYEVCRHYESLNGIVNNLVSKRPKDIEVVVTLLIGLYQLHYSNKKDYAIVNETVALMDLIKKPYLKKFLNGVFRQYLRNKDSLMRELQTKPNTKFDHPSWLIGCIKKDWPNDWQDILRALNKHPPLNLRINRQITTLDNYIKKFASLPYTLKPNKYSPDGLCIEPATDVKTLPGFAEGEFSVQDEAAQLAAPLLDLKPGHRVLDACCAPGGKLCHMLEIEPNLSYCLGLEIDNYRQTKVLENLQRLNLTANLINSDAILVNKWWDKIPFDRILLDAPCSSLGVIRRHPDIKILREFEDIENASTLQYKLLTTLWALLKPGGKLLYCTCSILKRENEAQIRKFTKSNKDCLIDNSDKPWGLNTGFGWQILPHSNMDGFFYALLTKL